MIDKPPLGLMPRYIWEEMRASDLKSAMNRRLQANMPIPPKWVEEYNELIERIPDKKF